VDNIGLVPQAVVTGLIMGMIYALVAAGLALIWGVVDIVNFAHGEYMLVAMYVTIIVSNDFGLDPMVLIPLNAVLLFVAGYATYYVIISKVMEAPMLAQIFATFGLVLVIRFSALFLAGPYTESVDQFMFGGNSTVGGINLSHPEVVTAAVSVVTLAVLFVFMRTTKLGKAIRAVSQDWEAAQVMGIDPDRVNALTWGIGLAAVGIAGTMVATFFPTQPELTPTTWTLIAFASVALGGFGSVLGAVFGGVSISLVEHLGATLLDPSYKELYVFLMFIGALLYRAEGGLQWRE
jgi:branched-chain amino acid transport system permease protein